MKTKLPTSVVCLSVAVVVCVGGCSTGNPKATGAPQQTHYPAASSRLANDASNPLPSSQLTVRMDMSSGHPKVYVSRQDLEAALGKKLADDNHISPFDAIPWLVCSQNPADATGTLRGDAFASIAPANDKPGSGYLLVFDSASQAKLKQYAYVAVTLCVYEGEHISRRSNTIVVKMPTSE